MKILNIKKKKFFVFILLGVILFLFFIFFNKVSNRNISTNIVATDDFYKAYYKDIEIENNSDVTKTYNLNIEVMDISKELLNSNFIFIIAKKSDYDESYYEIQRVDSENLSTSLLVNTLYFTISAKKRKRNFIEYIFGIQKQMIKMIICL